MPAATSSAPPIVLPEGVPTYPGARRPERSRWVDSSGLRIAVYELLRETDVPQVVIVNEAIELAKRYGSEQSGAFVNGVLDGLVHSGSFEGRLH